jgi:hypothetical protein
MITEEKGWSCKCDLCKGSRISPGSDGWRGGWAGHPAAMPDGRALECPWCRAVRFKYGDYWCPVKREEATRQS